MASSRPAAKTIAALICLLALPLPTAAAPTIGGCAVFPADSIWNTRVDTLPVHARSGDWIASIGGTRGFHMDFGSGTWDGGPIGIPFNVVAGSAVGAYTPTFYYPDESDAGPYPIPDSPLREHGSDHHVLVLDTETCRLYEIYDASFAGGAWSAGSGAIWDLGSHTLRPDGWTSADAAGLPILPGLVRYEEAAAGRIDHAIRFTASVTQRAYLWPARHFASSNTSPAVPPMGARFRLKASYDITGFAAPARAILQAMKSYGIILADNGSNWYVSGAPDERWDNDMLHTLDVLTGNDFEAVDASGLMVDPDSGQAASSSASPSPSHVLWTRSDTGQAALWAVDAGTLSGALPISNAAYLRSRSGVGGPWHASAYEHVSGSEGYVLWTRSDTGQAALWKVNPAAMPAAIPIVASAYLRSSSGVGRPWEATGYQHVSDTTGYVLWTRGDTGQAAIWKVNPVTGAITGSAYLFSSTGVGRPWRATGYEHVSDTTGYVLWTRSDTGQAALWRIDPSGIGADQVIPIQNSAYLHAAAGVGGPWQATSYAHVGDAEGYVLWTRSDTGQAALWKVNPGAMPGVIPITGSAFLQSKAGVGGPWQATGYAHGAQSADRRAVR